MLSELNFSLKPNLYGKVFKSIIDDKEFVLIPKENEDLVNLKQVPKSEVIRAIEPRVSEMFEIMNNYVKNFHSLISNQIFLVN